MKILNIVIILFTSSSIFGQMDGLKKGDKWEYEYPLVQIQLDRDENEVVKHFSNRTEFNFYEGLAKVQFDIYVGFVDSNKRIVVPVIYDITSQSRFADARAIVNKERKTGLIDMEGNVVIPFKFWRLRYDDSLFFALEGYYTSYSDTNNSWGYFDRNGKVVLPISDHNRECNFCEITYDEILELAEIYDVKDSLEKSTNFSKEKAIKKAKRSGCYWNNEFSGNNPKIKLDSGQWIISGTRPKGVIVEDCKAHGGCYLYENVLLILDASTGKVIKESKFEFTVVKMEGPPPPQLIKKRK